MVCVHSGCFACAVHPSADGCQPRCSLVLRCSRLPLSQDADGGCVAKGRRREESSHGQTLAGSTHHHLTEPKRVWGRSSIPHTNKHIPCAHTHVLALLDGHTRHAGDGLHAQLLHGLPALLFRAALLPTSSLCSTGTQGRPSCICVQVVRRVLQLLLWVAARTGPLGLPA